MCVAMCMHVCVCLHVCACVCVYTRVCMRSLLNIVKSGGGGALPSTLQSGGAIAPSASHVLRPCTVKVVYVSYFYCCIVISYFVVSFIFCYCIAYFLQCVYCVLYCCTVYIYFCSCCAENQSRLMQFSL